MLALAGIAHAGGLETVLGLQSDKRLRGFSQSDGDPVASVDAAWRADGGFLAQAGLSTLGRDRRRGDAELVLGAGCGGAIAEAWAWQATATHYRVLGGGSLRRAPYDELALSLAGPARWDLLLAVAPAYPGRLPSGSNGRGRTVVTEVGWHPRLAPGWVLDLGVGQVRYADLVFADHAYGSVGLTWRRGSLDVSATRVFRGGPGPAADARAVLAMSWRL
jgi:hypothetical protein